MAARVQGLVEAGIAQVPPEYIQPLENRPSNSPGRSSNCVPVIDLDAEDSLRDAIGEACRDWGAFYVINHGVHLDLLDRIKTVGLSFFNDYPLHDKLAYACDPNTSASQGYGSKMLLQQTDADSDSDSAQPNATALDWRDYFDHHTLPLSRRDPSRWPHFPPHYRETVAAYSDAMKMLAQKLLGVISESLGLASSGIEDAVGEFYQNITMSYYPPCPQPDLTLGLQSHSDMGAITLLIQDDVGGLQVFKDHRWITVHPLPHAILVILADQTEIISNGKYRSAQHRAITNSSKARLSVATFHDPAKTVRISPAVALVGEASPPKYKAVNYGDYVLSWYTKGPEGKRNIDALLIDS